MERHRRGLARLVTALAQKQGYDASEVLVVLAHRASRIGCAAQEHLDLSGTNDVIVIPGLLRDLPAWIERMALTGPVYDHAGNDDGIAVIVVDATGEMALCRIDIETSAATVDHDNRRVIPPGQDDGAGKVSRDARCRRCRPKAKSRRKNRPQSFPC
jgi:hypothetical protein